MSHGSCAACGAPLSSPVSDGPAICPACALEGALASARAPVRFGDFEILEEVGRGGMGVVYRARQRSVDRVVAIKTLLPGLADPEHLRRFQEEASTAAGLQHPNIVAIHDVGEWDGHPFIAMDFVAGESLAARVGDEGGNPDYEQVARWVAAIADAVQYAHDRGVLHRDLKPSNVLVDEAGQPRVTDFGLAKRLGDASAVTLSGQAVGSPGFMSPEQAGGGQKVSRRSDVYGLGATLYFALTGRAPFQGDSPAQVMHDVLTVEPRAPRSLRPAVPRDLETICLGCLEKDPQRRYPSARAVAEDLRRFLDARPVLAHPVGPAGKAWRWSRRRPLLAASILGAAISVAAAGWLGAQLSQARTDRVLDDALDAVMRGDPDATTIVEKAERRGVPAAWVHMLKGQLALNSPRPRDASFEFEKAVALAPRSVAARAMLATGYLYGGQLDRYITTLAQVQQQKLAPSSWQDYLFLGAALYVVNPDRASVALLERANQMHTSGSTFLQLALAEGFHARQVGSLDFAEKALEHCGVAAELLGPAHPVVPCVRMNALNAAIRLAPESGRTAFLRQAAETASSMGAEPSYICRVQRAMYLGIAGDARAELEEWRVTLHLSGGSGQYSSYFAAAMLAAGRSREALDELRAYAASDVWAAVARAYLLLDIGRRDEAEQQYEQACTGQPFFRTMAESILLFGGDRERVRRNAARLQETPPVGDPDRLVPGYLAGRRTAEELLGAADSRPSSCRAHFWVGLITLASGDRATARRHFSESVASGAHFEHAYQWSRAFISRLDRDPRWPEWILQENGRRLPAG